MRKKNIQRLVIAAVLLIVLPFVISQFMLECLTKLFAMDPDQASTIASTGQFIEEKDDSRVFVTYNRLPT